MYIKKRKGMNDASAFYHSKKKKKNIWLSIWLGNLCVNAKANFASQKRKKKKERNCNLSTHILQIWRL